MKLKGKHQKKPDRNQQLIILGLIATILEIIDKLVDIISKLIK